MPKLKPPSVLNKRKGRGRPRSKVYAADYTLNVYLRDFIAYSNGTIRCIKGELSSLSPDPLCPDVVYQRDAEPGAVFLKIPSNIHSVKEVVNSDPDIEAQLDGFIAGVEHGLKLGQLILFRIFERNPAAIQNIEKLVKEVSELITGLKQVADPTPEQQSAITQLLDIQRAMFRDFPTDYRRKYGENRYPRRELSRLHRNIKEFQATRTLMALSRATGYSVDELLDRINEINRIKLGNISIDGVGDGAVVMI